MNVLKFSLHNVYMYNTTPKLPACYIHIYVCVSIYCHY